MSVDNLEREYLADKKYIHETLSHTVQYVEKLDEKFDEFKLETAKSIVIIQTKLALYIAAGSLITGIIINAAFYFINKA